MPLSSSVGTGQTAVRERPHCLPGGGAAGSALPAAVQSCLVNSRDVSKMIGAAWRGYARCHSMGLDL